MSEQNERTRGKTATEAARVCNLHGEILTPLAGTIRWGAGGEQLGVWGRDFPCIPHINEGGKVRPMTRAERRARAAWDRKRGRT